MGSARPERRHIIQNVKIFQVSLKSTKRDNCLDDMIHCYHLPN